MKRSTAGSYKPTASRGGHRSRCGAAALFAILMAHLVAPAPAASAAGCAGPPDDARSTSETSTSAEGTCGPAGDLTIVETGCYQVVVPRATKASALAAIVPANFTLQVSPNPANRTTN